MNPVEIIRKKRSGEKLSRIELEFFIKNFLDGKIADYQMSALLMAVYFRGMDDEETTILTEQMLYSGVVVDLSEIPGIKVDKHSTGGVGDKVSLILAPMVAACGVPVPMISGRGLGHTGGTLDKLESIPGFNVNLSLEEYKNVIREIGLVMIGQTKEIAPADKRMYALRDVTATVESIPLISGSIMSKKLAEGIDALVLDIKTGRGAFMQTFEQSVSLANSLVRIGNLMGKKTLGFITAMDEPLGFAIGNWLEVVECIECMKGKNVSDLMEVTYVLGGAMLQLGGKATTLEEGISKCKEVIANGKAYDKFLQLVKKQNGDISFIENTEKYPKSKLEITIEAMSDGFISAIDSLEVGLTAIMLGAGRMKMDDVLDMKAGIMLKKKVGDSVKKGETLATMFTDTVSESAKQRLQNSFTISSSQPKKEKLMKAVVNEKGVREF
ncbi:MAG: thymidine phosphorylase [Bacteroidota bacterium]